MTTDPIASARSPNTDSPSQSRRESVDIDTRPPAPERSILRKASNKRTDPRPGEEVLNDRRPDADLRLITAVLGSYSPAHPAPTTEATPRGIEQPTTPRIQPLSDCGKPEEPRPR